MSHGSIDFKHASKESSPTTPARDKSPKSYRRVRLTVTGVVICLQLTAENYSRPAAPMLVSSSYSPAVSIKLAKHARQLNLFAMSTKEISRAEHVQPCFVEPMQVSAVRELPDGGFWTYEAKLDGYRCLAAKRGNNVMLWSRRGTGFTQRFPSIARACEKLPSDTLIDAEIVVVDENGALRIQCPPAQTPQRPYPAIRLRYSRAPRSKCFALTD